MIIEAFSESVALLPTLALRLAVAVLCGFILGVERERKDKPAGLRTIVLISFGSALFMIVGNLVPFAYDWVDLSRIDPSRVASTVVTGIGFLGAGTIIQARGSIQGLTTAAVIWVAAAIGMCAGMGYLILAFGSTGLVLAALVTMNPLRARLTRLGNRYEMEVVVPNDSLTLRRILYALDAHDISHEEIEVHRLHDGEIRVEFVYHGFGGAASRLLEAIARIERVHGSEVRDDFLSTRL